MELWLKRDGRVTCKLGHMTSKQALTMLSARTTFNSLEAECDAAIGDISEITYQDLELVALQSLVNRPCVLGLITARPPPVVEVHLK